MMARAKSRTVLVPAVLPPDVVPHPRYGTKIRKSGHTLTEPEQRALGTCRRGTIWPESALPAAHSADRYGTPHVYVDRLLQCAGCARPFVFYAVEQRFWVQALGFHPDSIAVRCAKCRRSVRLIKRVLERVTEPVKTVKLQRGKITREALSDTALSALAADLLMLVEVGAMKKLDVLQRLRRAMTERTSGKPRDPFPDLIRRIDVLVDRATARTATLLTTA
jgi:Probable zinc-ribbon domain